MRRRGTLPLGGAVLGALAQSSQLLGRLGLGALQVPYLVSAGSQ